MAGLDNNPRGDKEGVSTTSTKVFNTSTEYIQRGCTEDKEENNVYLREEGGSIIRTLKNCFQVILLGPFGRIWSHILPNRF